MAKGEQCMVRGRSSPKGEETSRQGQRGTEDTTLPPGHLCWAEQLMKDEIRARAIVAQMVGMSSHRSKGRRFDSWSGHRDRL